MAFKSPSIPATTHNQRRAHVFLKISELSHYGNTEFLEFLKRRLTNLSRCLKTKKKKKERKKDRKKIYTKKDEQKYFIF